MFGIFDFVGGIVKGVVNGVVNTVKQAVSNPLGTIARLASPGGAAQMVGEGIQNIMKSAMQPENPGENA